MNCQICLWNHAYYLFDDSNYTEMKYGNINGYNHIINPYCYNSIYTCHECLIYKIYSCDYNLHCNLIDELKKYLAYNTIAKWWINKLYNIDSKIGKKFIKKKIKSTEFIF